MYKTLCMLLVCASLIPAQDRLTLAADGSVLTGRVAGLHAEGVRFQAEGSPSPRLVAWSEVAVDGLRTGGPVAVSLVNGDRLTGAIIGYGDGRITVASSFLGEVTIPVTSLGAAPPEEQVKEAEAAAEEKTILDPSPWKGKFGLYGSLRAGNVSSGLVRFSAAVERQWATDRLAAALSAEYGETEGDLTAAGVRGRAKWDHYLEKDFYLYGLVEAEHDSVQDLDLRALLGAGVGLNVWKGEGDNRSLDLEAGVTSLYEAFEDSDGELKFAGRLAVDYKDVFFDDLLFGQRFELLMPMPAVDEFIFRSVTSASVKVGEHWFVSQSLEIQWTNEPNGDTDELDLKALLGIEYSF